MEQATQQSIPGQEAPQKSGATKCSRCKRTLKDPVSVERGAGPVCAKRLGIAKAGHATAPDDWKCPNHFLLGASIESGIR